ncbi:hypothetical protein BLNAU_18983 [Blattamonas nauphoetae]|uniref:Uncharacterized protein n=1 Tax=Blattamonas nauphoetae TaxID=2049346 RepID=A0ABQ9X6X8_9EUKA|nr:hypothetical protein BLNAU_18983 [Blattamonas nauphoetae]
MLAVLSLFNLASAFRLNGITFPIESLTNDGGYAYNFTLDDKYFFNLRGDVDGTKYGCDNIPKGTWAFKKQGNYCTVLANQGCETVELIDRTKGLYFTYKIKDTFGIKLSCSRRSSMGFHKMQGRVWVDWENPAGCGKA